MKKVLSMFLALMICFGLCSCETNKAIKKLKKEISDFRNGSSSSIYISLSKKEISYDMDFMDFIEEQITEMCQNEEYSLLGEFVNALGKSNLDYYTIEQILNNYVPKFKDSESALKMVCKWYDDYHYYASRLKLNRNTGIISKYISDFGTKEVSKTSKKGFYANKQNQHKGKTIDFPTSKWYDEEGVRYFGDFKYEYAYSKNLFTNDITYSKDYYYFRDKFLIFDPTEGECVWSGSYLFCFSSTGELLGLIEVN